MITIYCFKHNDKVIYVGSTSQTLLRRVQKHQSSSSHPNCRTYLPVHNYINEVGWDAIKVDVVCTCDDDARLTTEREVLEKYKDTALNKYRPVISKEEHKKLIADWEKAHPGRHPKPTKDKQLEYDRRWRENNPEKVKEKNARANERNRQKIYCHICGEETTVGHLRRHNNTLRHITNFIEY